MDPRIWGPALPNVQAAIRERPAAETIVVLSSIVGAALLLLGGAIGDTARMRPIILGGLLVELLASVAGLLVADGGRCSSRPASSGMRRPPSSSPSRWPSSPRAITGSPGRRRSVSRTGPTARPARAAPILLQIVPGRARPGVPRRDPRVRPGDLARPPATARPASSRARPSVRTSSGRRSGRSGSSPSLSASPGSATGRTTGSGSALILLGGGRPRPRAPARPAAEPGAHQPRLHRAAAGRGRGLRGHRHRDRPDRPDAPAAAVLPVRPGLRPGPGHGGRGPTVRGAHRRGPGRRVPAELDSRRGPSSDFGVIAVGLADALLWLVATPLIRLSRVRRPVPARGCRVRHRDHRPDRDHLRERAARPARRPRRP